MTITCVQGAAIPNIVVFTTTQRSNALAAILLVQLADVWRSGATIATHGSIRVDSQGNQANGRANLQAQINGVQGSSTGACVLVDASVGQTGGPAAAAQQLNAIRQIRGALQNSLSTGKIYTLSGSPG